MGEPYRISGTEEVRNQGIIARHARARAAMLANGGHAAPFAQADTTPSASAWKMAHAIPMPVAAPSISATTPAPATTSADDPLTAWHSQFTPDGKSWHTPNQPVGSVIDSGSHMQVDPFTGAAVRHTETPTGTEIGPMSAGEKANIELLYAPKGADGNAAPVAGFASPPVKKAIAVTPQPIGGTLGTTASYFDPLNPASFAAAAAQHAMNGGSFQTPPVATATPQINALANIGNDALPSTVPNSPLPFHSAFTSPNSAHDDINGSLSPQSFTGTPLVSSTGGVPAPSFPAPIKPNPKKSLPQFLSALSQGQVDL